MAKDHRAVFVVSFLNYFQWRIRTRKFPFTLYAVKGRENILGKEWRDDLHKYIVGIIENEGCKSLAVGGWKDHVHIFFGHPPNKNVSEIVQVVKANSSKWVNKNKFIAGKFEWQSGFSAFSYARSQRDNVTGYIMGHEEHHRIKSFREEYLEMMNKFEVEYEDRYLFEFFD